MNTTHKHVPHFIANNLALDFVNSVFGTGQERHDCFTDDQSVVAWLQAAGMLSATAEAPPAGLAAMARELREAAGQLINAARLGQPGEHRLVNQILDDGRSTRALAWDCARARFAWVERRQGNSASSLLEPVAVALASLLTDGDLRQIRQCEAHDCTLLFLDTTKSKRRRWCSMAACGNRMKVAAFRSRQQAD